MYNLERDMINSPKDLVIKIRRILPYTLSIRPDTP